MRNELISRSDNSSHPSNIQEKSLAKVVSKFERSSEVSDEQYSNILLKSSAFDVSKFETSTEASDLQPWNI